MNTPTEITPTKITAADLVREIRARYEAPEWLVESEVTLAGRRLDVVAFRLWGGRTGHRIVGFETKISRGDWMRELADFRKSEEWMQVVDAFYVVTPPKLVKPEELPQGWGLLELTGSKMMTKAHALHKEPSVTLPRELTARLLNRMHDRVRDADRTAEWKARHELREEITKQVERNAGIENERLRDENNDLRRWKESMLDALGINRHVWNGNEVAMRAAGIFAKMDIEAPDRGFRQSATRYADALREKLASIDELLVSLDQPVKVEVSNAA